MTRSAWLFVLFLSACTGRSLEGGGLQSGASQSGGSQSGGSENDASQNGSGIVDAGTQKDAAPTPVTGGIACGAQTCGPKQFCFTDCCESQTVPCYARPSQGCKQKSDEIPACNGVPNGCICEESDPSKCPAPPPCSQASVPFCITPSADNPEGCGFSSPNDNPCFASASECDPNARQITCFCAM